LNLLFTKTCFAMKRYLPQWEKVLHFTSLVRGHSNKLRPVLFVLALFLSSALFAQNTVTGRIAAGDTALSGVTVQVKGTNTVTQTNATGNFTINAPSNATLVFTYVGYAPQEVKVNSRTNISVQLESVNQQLTDVVVVGYGTQKRATVTGAVSSVGSKDLLTTPATTTSGALVGKVQGITTRSPDSRPGRGVNIQIRNMGNPLFVIDGIPYTGGSTTATAFGFNQGSGQDVFNTLGLEDIENISILKDASASIATLVFTYVGYAPTRQAI